MKLSRKLSQAPYRDHDYHKSSPSSHGIPTSKTDSLAKSAEQHASDLTNPSLQSSILTNLFDESSMPELDSKLSPCASPTAASDEN
ncbi:hypothetical protein N7G274_003236 [Stereocaulon virgatum]|uniref:Uncharacterized protein n=1 Tax=Stereocaulon virgatum TaxID=373712 RepID=A0ABR4AD25_9LECA